MHVRSLAAALLIATAGASADAQILFQNSRDNGYFTPFNASTSSSVRYGDSGWFGSGGDAPAALESITLGLAFNGSTRAGTTDLTFTFNDGDPSGLVFGSGSQLFSTTIHAVELPDVSELGAPYFFSVTIPLAGVSTFGGFNNFGWSVGVSNFNSDGNLGFQCSTAFGQNIGFYTNNASFYNGSSWSLFSFGQGTTGVANFVTTLTAVPAAPTAVVPLAALAVLARRRR